MTNNIDSNTQEHFNIDGISSKNDRNEHILILGDRKKRNDIFSLLVERNDKLGNRSSIFFTSNNLNNIENNEKSIVLDLNNPNLNLFSYVQTEEQVRMLSYYIQLATQSTIDEYRVAQSREKEGQAFFDNNTVALLRCIISNIVNEKPGKKIFLSLQKINEVISLNIEDLCKWIEDNSMFTGIKNQTFIDLAKSGSKNAIVFHSELQVIISSLFASPIADSKEQVDFDIHSLIYKPTTFIVQSNKESSNLAKLIFLTLSSFISDHAKLYPAIYTQNKPSIYIEDTEICLFNIYAIERLFDGFKENSLNPFNLLVGAESKNNLQTTQGPDRDISEEFGIKLLINDNGELIRL